MQIVGVRTRLKPRQNLLISLPRFRNPLPRYLGKVDASVCYACIIPKVGKELNVTKHQHPGIVLDALTILHSLFLSFTLSLSSTSNKRLERSAIQTSYHRSQDWTWCSLLLPNWRINGKGTSISIQWLLPPVTAIAFFVGLMFFTLVLASRYSSHIRYLAVKSYSSKQSTNKPYLVQKKMQYQCRIHMDSTSQMIYILSQMSRFCFFKIMPIFLSYLHLFFFLDLNIEVQINLCVSL